MMTIDVEQRTAEWLEARRGRVTASRIADACAVLKRATGEAAARRTYRLEMICEMLTGFTIEHYVSMWMEEGQELEPRARTAYEDYIGNEVDQVGFVLHESNPRFGASPDGLVGYKGLVEIKCPKITTHLGYLIADEVPEDYQPQMLWQMACCGPERVWCDFVSFCPGMPEKQQLFIKRLERDDARIAEMEVGAAKFIAEVDEAVARLMAK